MTMLLSHQNKLNLGFAIVILVYRYGIAEVWGFPLEIGRGVLRGKNSNSTAFHTQDDEVELMSLTDPEALVQAFDNQTILPSEGDKRNMNAMLNFQGEFTHHQHVGVGGTHSSLTTTMERLYEFFQNRRHRNLLLKGGDNPTEEIPWTPELLAEWAAQSRFVSSAPPRTMTSPMEFRMYGGRGGGSDIEQHHSVVAIHSTVPIVPGLFIKAISYMGCNLLPHPQSLLPMYEFTLIQDQYQAEGTKALVWLYRKVTGEMPPTTGKGVEEQNGPPMTPARYNTSGSRNTHGLCRVFLEPLRPPSHDGANEMLLLRLSYYSMVKVKCNLPQRLLKMIPLSKQNIEAKISSSMTKQLETEVMQSADKFHAALEAWLQQGHGKY